MSVMQQVSIEQIDVRGRTLAYLIRSGAPPERSMFPTPPEVNLQVGYIVYAAGNEIRRHFHKPVERKLTGTCEVLIVIKGRCEIDVYDDRRRLVATRELRTGDIVVIVGGGHGFRMVEDTVLIEVKQGPYAGDGEKEYF